LSCLQNAVSVKVSEAGCPEALAQDLKPQKTLGRP
jgi:hypothetical protein